MFDVNLQWHPFNINIAIFLSEIDSLISTPIVGTSANSVFQIHFSEQPTEEEIELIKMHWDELTEGSIEATSYKSAAQIKQEAEAEKQSLLSSARVKLAALGLSEAEINAIIGVN